MVPPTLWVEIIIAGFVYLLAFFFFVLNKAGIYDFGFMPPLADFVGLISLLVVFASYIFGFLMHRLVQIVILNIVAKLLGKLGFDFNLLGDAKPGFYRDSFALYQYGSPALHREIDLQYSAFALFTSLVFSLPLLGASLFFWLGHTDVKDWALSVLLTCIGLSILSLLVNIRQRERFNRIRDAAFKELRDIHQKNLREDRANKKKTSQAE